MADLGRPLTLSFDISKVDETQRYVGGYATVEEPDKQNDIVDYAGSVEAFNAWPGNIREQHDPKRAVGKAIEIRPEAETKRIWLGAYLSRSRDGEDALTKCREGVLKGFSIKGEVLDSRTEAIRKAGSGKPKLYNRILKYRLDEVSLVDNPACPSALIHLVKSADGVATATEVLKSADDLPDAHPGEGQEETVPDTLVAPLEKADPGQLAEMADMLHALGSMIVENPADPALEPIKAALAQIAQALQISTAPPAPVAPPPAAMPPEPAPAEAPPEMPPAPEPPAEEEKSAAGDTLQKGGPAGAPWPDNQGQDDDQQGEGEKDEKPAPEKKPALDIQAIHDLLVTLGATCDKEKPEQTESDDEDGEEDEEGDQMKSMGAAEVEALVDKALARRLEKADTDRLAKLDVAREVLVEATKQVTQLQATVAEQTNTLVALEKRLAQIEEAPDPKAQLPAIRQVHPGAVEKALGEVMPTVGSVTEADEATLTKLVDSHPSQLVRQQAGYLAALLEMRKIQR